jgi:Ca2+/Na+ antiporter
MSGNRKQCIPITIKNKVIKRDFKKIYQQDCPFCSSIFSLYSLFSLFSLFSFSKPEKISLSLSNKKMDFKIVYKYTWINFILELLIGSFEYRKPICNKCFEDRTEYDKEKYKNEYKDLPKAVHKRIWENQYGKDNTVIKCPICNEFDISPFNFDTCHIKPESKDGSCELKNLLAGCSSCNTCMGTKHLYDYQKKYFPDVYLKRTNKLLYYLKKYWFLIILLIILLISIILFIQSEDKLFGPLTSLNNFLDILHIEICDFSYYYFNSYR